MPGANKLLNQDGALIAAWTPSYVLQFVGGKRARRSPSQLVKLLPGKRVGRCF